ncbi:MAG: diaminopimelate epimerase [Ruminococcaceae bacterium]|nr:diaminopimelate epimerase [Oscillospiraceae bacterium]
MKFTKMHGIGNDYIYINCFEEKIDDPSGLSIAMSPRHFSVGSDGLVLICPSDIADAKMRMFNADGSEGKMCGNAIRCVGKYLYEHGIVKKTQISVETLSGIKELTLTVDEKDKVASVRVYMGKASTSPESIPVLLDHEMVKEEIEVLGKKYTLTGVSMGNPHAVCFDWDPDALELEKIGPSFENHELFPERVNTEFAKVIDPTHIRMRVWERGSGETYACGTGACATVVASVICGYSRYNEPVKVSLIGGELEIVYSDNGDVFMSGSATEVYEGVYNYEN